MSSENTMNGDIPTQVDLRDDFDEVISSVIVEETRVTVIQTGPSGANTGSNEGLIDNLDLDVFGEPDDTENVEPVEVSDASGETTNERSESITVGLETAENGATEPGTEDASATEPATEDASATEPAEDSNATEPAEDANAIEPAEDANATEPAEDSNATKPATEDTGSIEASPLNIAIPENRRRKHSLTFEAIEKHSHKKKVPGRVVDQLWEPLDSKNMVSLDRILNISLTKAIERYSLDTERTTRSQSILFNAWLNESPNSFKSRLAATKLPPPSSMSTEKDILNFDQIFRRKRFLETYLLAELKQLSELKNYHNELNTVFEQDSKYLREFTKTTKIDSKQMEDEINNKSLILKLDQEVKNEDDIKLAPRQKLEFDPKEDAESREILELVDGHFASIAENTTSVARLNEKLEVIYNLLEMV